MNYGVMIFLGALLTLSASWYAMVVAPVIQLGSQQPEKIETTGGLYPTGRPGLAQQGREVYRANGCNYCHTQKVLGMARGEGTNFVGYVGGDIERGWGIRPSVAEDYMMESPVMLGTQRIGQDLMNIGARQTNEVWHLQHLYNPQSLSPGSAMPPYRYLFEKRRIKGAPSGNALPLESDAGVEPGYEIVPKNSAQALVAYLLSLEARTPLFEAPLPAKPKAEGDTNQPPKEVLTNAPAPTGAVK
jgi:cytochrome c oxidase cbb3-type subunit 2